MAAAKSVLLVKGPFYLFLCLSKRDHVNKQVFAYYL